MKAKINPKLRGAIAGTPQYSDGAPFGYPKITENGNGGTNQLDFALRDCGLSDAVIAKFTRIEGLHAGSFAMFIEFPYLLLQKPFFLTAEEANDVLEKVTNPKLRDSKTIFVEKKLPITNQLEPSEQVTSTGDVTSIDCTSDADGRTELLRAVVPSPALVAPKSSGPDYKWRNFHTVWAGDRDEVTRLYNFWTVTFYFGETIDEATDASLVRVIWQDAQKEISESTALAFPLPAFPGSFVMLDLHGKNLPPQFYFVELLDNRCVLVGTGLAWYHVFGERGEQPLTETGAVKVKPPLDYAYGLFFGTAFSLTTPPMSNRELRNKLGDTDLDGYRGPGDEIGVVECSVNVLKIRSVDTVNENFEVQFSVTLIWPVGITSGVQAMYEEIKWEPDW